MLEQISKAIKDDFIDKLLIFNNILQIDLSKHNFVRRGNSNEISFRSFYLNPSVKFAGKYFENQLKTLTIWIGYSVEYDFCISFWSKDQNLVDSIIDILRRKKRDCFCSYSGMSHKGKEDKYWCNLKLNNVNNKEGLQNEIDDIIESIKKTCKV